MLPPGGGSADDEPDRAESCAASKAEFAEAYAKMVGGVLAGLEKEDRVKAATALAEGLAAIAAAVRDFQ
jgi:hypothetical protein